MSSDPSQAVLHRVRVPVGGMTVAEARARAAALDIAPEAPEARLLGLEQVDTGWEVEVTFAVGASGVVPVAVELRSTRGRPVTRAAWDRVRVAEVIEEAAALVAWFGPISPKPEQAQPFEAGPRRRGGARGRPRQYSDDHYRRVAAIYNAAVMSHLRPLRAVKKAFVAEFPGLDSPSDKRARAWVRVARGRGWITEEEGDDHESD